MKTIALSMRLAKSEYGELRDCIAQDWISHLAQQNIHPKLVPNNPNTFAQYLNDADALILSGGNDIVLSSPEKESDDPVAIRDRTEYALLAYAIQNSIPVLGICRGIQLINYYYSGTLKPIEGHVLTGHESKSHTVEIQNAPNNLFIDGPLSVNSYHNSGLDRIGKGLTTFATAFDGSAEGIYHEKDNVTGIMWHPERTFEDETSSQVHADLISRFLSS